MIVWASRLLSKKFAARAFKTCFPYWALYSKNLALLSSSIYFKSLLRFSIYSSVFLFWSNVELNTIESLSALSIWDFIRPSSLVSFWILVLIAFYWNSSILSIMAAFMFRVLAIDGSKENNTWVNWETQ
jgi:hypothetical protein